ncbi:magnesium/cobalt transporter CorA [soil metagenome]
MTIQAILYRADAPDQEIELAGFDVSVIAERQLLWIDLASPSPDELQLVSERLGFPQDELALAEAGARPGLVNYGKRFRVQAKAVGLKRSADKLARDPLTLMVGPNFVVTVHDAESDFLNRLREQDQGDSDIGALSAEAFAASLLDWMLDTYFRALDVLVHDIDRVEVVILGRRAPPENLGVLVAARRRVADLRRSLKEHRDVFYGLARPDFMATDHPEARPRFDALSLHYERAEDDLENARDLVVGSFELLATRVAQKTNDTMRVLTFATVLMGLLALVAGLLGMNFPLPLFTTGLRGFLLVVGAMLGFALLSLVIAVRKRWF